METKIMSKEKIKCKKMHKISRMIAVNTSHSGKLVDEIRFAKGISASIET